MMAGNPSRWMHAPPNSPFVFGSSSSAAVSSSSFPDNYHQEQLPPHQSWSQLLMGRLSGGEEEDHIHSFVQGKKLENWEDHQILNLNPFHYSRLLLQPSSPVVVGSDVKQEVALTNNLCLYNEEILRPNNNCWSQQQVLAAVSSPRSCVTSNILDFSYNNKPNNATTQHHLDQSSECNSTATGGVSKKPRVQPSSSQPPLKVRKEKLGDRITALHQLVSPFGKTDTASVLLEAIGYIRFLQSQIEALSLPYLGATPSSNLRNQQFVQGERNCVFPEDPGQLLNDICQKRKGGPNQDGQDRPKDLRSRGLCLVPVSCTQHVGSDNGADYWAPAIGGGF